MIPWWSGCLLSWQTSIDNSQNESLGTFKISTFWWKLRPPTLILSTCHFLLRWVRRFDAWAHWAQNPSAIPLLLLLQSSSYFVDGIVNLQNKTSLIAWPGHDYCVTALDRSFMIIPITYQKSKIWTIGNLNVIVTKESVFGSFCPRKKSTKWSLFWRTDDFWSELQGSSLGLMPSVVTKILSRCTASISINIRLCHFAFQLFV